MLKTLNLTILLFLVVASTCFAQDGWFIVTPSGDRLAWVEADEISPAGDMIKIKKNGKYGLIDINGNMKIKPKYADIKGASNGLICVKANGKYGYMTTKGYFPIEAKYTDATNFTADGIATVKNRGEWGFIDRHGKLLIDYQYAEATPFQNGYSIVRRLMSKTEGIINTKGEYVVSGKKYLNVRFPGDGLVAARVQGGGKWGFVDMNGRTAVEHQYQKVTQFNEGYALVSADGSKFGVIDKRGNEVAPAMFDNAKIEGYNNGLAAVVYEGKWGFVNTKGEIVIPFEYEEVTSFSEGKAAVLMDGYWGYVDASGEFTVLPEFERAGAFYKMNGRPIALAKEGDMPPIEVRRKKRKRKWKSMRKNRQVIGMNQRKKNTKKKNRKGRKSVLLFFRIDQVRVKEKARGKANALKHLRRQVRDRQASRPANPLADKQKSSLQRACTTSIRA